VTARRSAALPLALALTAALLSLAACGEKEERTSAPPTERLRLVLDFFPNADHAGIYAAEATGAFRRAGLDVEIQTPSDPAAPLKLLAAGRADLAISYEPELLLARDKGQELVGVGALVQRPLTSIMSVGSRAITRPEQLRGKRVGTAGIPYQSAYLKAILRRAGVEASSVREVSVGFNLVPAMLSKRVDATLGAFWNYEGVQLRLERRRPRITRVDEAGVPTYDELVFVAREDALGRGGARVRRFLRAVAQGHEALRSDPATGIDPLLRANRDLERRLQLASVRATLPVFFPEDDDRPWGWQEPSEWAAYARWMYDNDLISQPGVGQALTNEFLPGEGPVSEETRPGAAS
jgi:putative hydroxymethylpyrimidine transport system substrate-binding protein